MGTKWLLGLRIGGPGGEGDLKWTGAAKVGLSGLRGVPIPHAFRVHGRPVFGAVRIIAIRVTGE